MAFNDTARATPRERALFAKHGFSRKACFQGQCARNAARNIKFTRTARARPRQNLLFTRGFLGKLQFEQSGISRTLCEVASRKKNGFFREKKFSRTLRAQHREKSHLSLNVALCEVVKSGFSRRVASQGHCERNAARKGHSSQKRGFSQKLFIEKSRFSRTLRAQRRKYSSLFSQTLMLEKRGFSSKRGFSGPFSPLRVRSFQRVSASGEREHTHKPKQSRTQTPHRVQGSIRSTSWPGGPTCHLHYTFCK